MKGDYAFSTGFSEFGEENQSQNLIALICCGQETAIDFEASPGFGEALASMVASILNPHSFNIEEWKGNFFRIAENAGLFVQGDMVFFRKVRNPLVLQHVVDAKDDREELLGTRMALGV